MHRIKLISIIVLSLLLYIPTEKAQAQPLPPDINIETVQESESSNIQMTRDPELIELLEKYNHLLISGQVSVTELQKMIANEKNEKAQFLGMKIQITGTPDQIQSLGFSLCIRPIWGPGKVRWQFPNPGRNGARYSVLPETKSSLIWAQPPEQAVDGIYRAGWGSCVAYKIPDSATMTFYSAESAEVCYNIFACTVLGHCPKWVNPCDNRSSEGPWPDHPLR